MGVIVVLATLASGPTPNTSGGTTSGAAPLCQGVDPQAPDPGAAHGLYVLSPPTSPHDPYYADIATTLLPNRAVCGADFWVHWNSIDQGPSATPQYNFTHLDAELAPWVAAGKVVNLIFWSVGYGPNSTYLPPNVLSTVTLLQCAGSADTPLFWQSAFELPYQAFIRAAVHHYEGRPGIGYLRFGLGTGGEVFPLVDLGSPGCEDRLNSSGFSIERWDQYLVGMLHFEHSLNSSLQLMVGLNNVLPGRNDNVSAVIASAASQYGFGIGSQGLQASAVMVDPSTGGAGCNGGWCRYFAEYAGKIPLELQTLGPTAPDGSPPIGALPPLLSYGLAEHAQVFELYFSDWLTAFDPNYPGFAASHASYAAALSGAASILGETPAS
ncbi:MAG: hypothetical protein L3K19_09095 [Thermoplasmata archaeon]|nr:hypothetical protein [Thermoplasmata archaeon]